MFQLTVTLGSYALIQNPTLGLGNRVVIILSSIVMALISRFILMRYMNRLMLSKSKKSENTTDEANQNVELHNKSVIEFNMLDSHSDFSTIAQHREIMVSRAQKSMWQQFKLDILIVMVYAVAGFIFYIDILVPEDIQRALSYALYVGLFLVWTIMRYVGFRHQFKAYQKGLFRLISPLWKVFFALFQSRWYMLLALVVLFSAFTRAFFALIVGMFPEGLVMLFAVVFHLVMIYRVRKKARTRPNLKLLILRVFLINKTSLFTFSRLAKFWQHFGTYFTVSDPSFYRVYWKRKFKHKFPVFIVLMFLLYTQLESASVDSQTGSPMLPFMFLLFMGSFVFIVYNIRRMKRNFVSHEKALDKDLVQLNKYPVKLDKTFKEKPVSCYDNTWKMTVDKLVTHANVVLMDLRGFSEKNKGCEYEVNLLLNNVSLDKILFLGYPKAIPLIKNVISKNFETLTVNSPNKKLNKLEASVFVVQKENNEETQHIIDVLIQKAMLNEDKTA